MVRKYLHLQWPFFDENVEYCLNIWKSKTIKSPGDSDHPLSEAYKPFTFDPVQYYNY